MPIQCLPSSYQINFQNLKWLENIQRGAISVYVPLTTFILFTRRAGYTEIKNIVNVIIKIEIKTFSFLSPLFYTFVFIL